MKSFRADAVIVGGGFFGTSLAAHLAASGSSVVLLEEGAGLLGRASYANQARIHNGYHYPRSLLTALRSRVNYPTFRRDYAACVRENFTHYYAVPAKFSKVTARQFQRFMERIGAPIRRADDRVRKLFDPVLIEDVFVVEECAFDAAALKDIALRQLAESGVTTHLETEVVRIIRRPANLEVVARQTDGEFTVETPLLLNCTYSRINTILARADLRPLKLKHEIAEMALVRIPEEISGLAFTVMCGPFFSLMPFPPRNLHTLSHVRYTPNCSWQEGPGLPVGDPYAIFAAHPKRSKFEHMRRDSARHLPALTKLEQEGSLWEVKTVLPQSEADDSRPILFRQADDDPRIWSIMGGKIDNVYDAIERWDARAAAVPATASPPAP
jgi:glycine/D-amino acid oxidase-like deaminating enzyme